MPLDPEKDALRARAVSELEEIARTVMPFGRCAGQPLYQLPAEYLQWFETKGSWPKGRLGVLMRIVFQMKADGSDVAFDAFRAPGHRQGRSDR